MDYNFELKINYINDITLTALKVKKQEISPSLGSDTLHFYTMHQSQVSIVNPTYKMSVRVSVCVSFHFFFCLPFPLPQEVNEQNSTLCKYI